MPPLMDHVADQSGEELVRLARVYNFPDFVKRADIQQTRSPGRLEPHLYADPRPGREQFPCHTAASTWLSALYFTEKRAEFHPKDQAAIQKRLDHYTSYWRIKAAVDAVQQRWHELHKQADDNLPDSMFAHVWVGDNGVKERRLRLKTAAEVKAAADYLYEYRDRITFADRHRMAVKVLDKAAAYGAGLSDKRDFMDRQAGRGVCDPAEVVSMIEDRARMVPPDRGVRIKMAEDGKEERTESLRDHFYKMAKTVRNMKRKDFSPVTMVKLAETIDMLDRQLGLVPRYASGLSRPEDVIFKASFAKVAEDREQIVATTSGKVYEKRSFAKVSVDDLEALFGEEFGSRVKTPLGELDCEKMAEEVAALPRPDAVLLDSLLSESGIRPLLTKAASSRQGLSDAEKKAWAEAYATAQ